MSTSISEAALSVEDRLQIHQLYADYAFAIDLGDADAWLSCFTDDGELGRAPREDSTALPITKGHDALRAMASMVGATVKGYHWNANVSVVPTVDGAAGRCYFMLLKAPTGVGEITVVGYFKDELVKLDRGWVFRKRIMHSL